MEKNMKNNKKLDILFLVIKTGYRVLDLAGFGLFLIMYPVVKGVSLILQKGMQSKYTSRHEKLEGRLSH